MASTRSRAPKLDTLYKHLRHQAEATGRDQGADLFKGARLAVRVHNGNVTLTVSRKGKPVGDVEINTFLAYCQVPATAQRWPSEGLKTRDATDRFLRGFLGEQVGLEDALVEAVIEELHDERDGPPPTPSA